MNEHIIEEARMVLEVVAALVMELEPDDQDVAEAVIYQVEKLALNEEMPEEFRIAAGDTLETSTELIEDDADIPALTDKLTEHITDLQGMIAHIEREMRGGDEDASDEPEDEAGIYESTGDMSPAKPSSGVFNELVTPDLIDAFIQNQRLMLDEFESQILSLEKDDGSADLDEVKRYIHNAKGEAGAIGLEALSGFLHDLESIIEQNKNASKRNIADGLLAAKDFLADFCDSLKPDNIPEIEDSLIDSIRTKFGVHPQKTGQPVKPVSHYRPIIINLDAERGELMDFVTETLEYLSNAETALLSLETNPESQEDLQELFRAFHNVKGIAGFLKLKDVGNIAHRTESLLDDAREGRIILKGNYADVCFDALDMLKELVEVISRNISGGKYVRPEGIDELLSRLDNPAESSEREVVMLPGKKIGEVLTNSGVIGREVIDKVLEKQHGGEKRPLGELLVEEGAVKAKDVALALRAQKKESSVKTPMISTRISSMIKVSTSRLDTLIDAVGELVIANSMVVQEPEIRDTKNEKLAQNVAHLGKITRELQELATSMRMISLKSTFQKLARIARDLSVKSGVPVEFSYSGEDTELDRNVVEEISSPLVHMVRNAVDHGIESPAERSLSDKPKKGSVRISAKHEGGNVVISIADDGKGLDVDKIRAKAEAKQLIEPGQELSREDIYNLIFKPGFSTAEEVTDVSGRGVGMDVVKKCIDGLRGRVEIKTQKGKGTEFIIRLPLTLAIIEGMLISVGKEKFIIPTIAIMKSIRPENGQVKTVVGKGEMLNVRDSLIPLFRLYRLFEIEGAVSKPEEALLVIITGDGKKCALLVDKLLGQQQVVIKSLGRAFDNLEGISGGAILGDGKVSLILDTTGLVRLANNAEFAPV